MAGGLCRATASPRASTVLAGRRARGSFHIERRPWSGPLAGGLVAVGAIHMKAGVFAIVPDLVSPEKLAADRFEAFCAFCSFRVTRSSPEFCRFAVLLQEDPLPVGPYKPSFLDGRVQAAYRSNEGHPCPFVRVDAGSHLAVLNGPVSAAAALAATLVLPRSEFIDNSIDEVVLEVGVPCGGTAFKILARPAGALRGIGAGLPLSTGRALQAQQMDHETAPHGGVRFGAYTGPMATQTIGTVGL